jgi:hypothetical protein
MNKFKGTPGPWQVVDTYEDYNEDSGIIIWDGDEQASGPICDMGEMGDMNYAEALANAHLIAAAPDLLEALVLATANLEALAMERFGDHWLKCNSYELLEKAKAAMNKALGGSDNG